MALILYNEEKVRLASIKYYEEHFILNLMFELDFKAFQFQFQI